MATANLSVESKDFTLPVVEATAGADGIVVSTLRNDGWVTLDPGFLTTAQCESKITYIDGKNSILRYRGYPIEQLCEQSDFLEVAWLLRHGELPNKTELENWNYQINRHRLVHENVKQIIQAFRYDAHPMAKLMAAVASMMTFYPSARRVEDPDARMRNVHRLLGKMPTMAASTRILSCLGR